MIIKASITLSTICIQCCIFIQAHFSYFLEVFPKSHYVGKH